VVRLVVTDAPAAWAPAVRSGTSRENCTGFGIHAEAAAGVSAAVPSAIVKMRTSVGIRPIPGSNTGGRRRFRAYVVVCFGASSDARSKRRSDGFTTGRRTPQITSHSSSSAVAVECISDQASSMASRSQTIPKSTLSR
jgi:hypothetical protein